MCSIPRWWTAIVLTAWGDQQRLRGKQLRPTSLATPTPEARVDCPDEAKFEVPASLSERFRRSREIMVNGARALPR